MKRTDLFHLLARLAAGITLLAVLLLSAGREQGASAATLLTTTVTVTGTINGEPIGGTGTGTTDLDTGASQLVNVYSSLPINFEPMDYGKSHKTVHHPNVALEVAGAKNFRSLSPAGYDVSATQTYANGDVIVTTAQVRPVSPIPDSHAMDWYTMDLQGTYTGPTNAVGIIPEVETLTSIAPGIVRGASHETIVFADGTTTTFSRVATYTLLNSAAVLPFDEALRITVDAVSFDATTRTLRLNTTATVGPVSVGGIVELPVDASGSPASPADGSGRSVPYGAVAGLAAAGAAMAASAWYARRRWLR